MRKCVIVFYWTGSPTSTTGLFDDWEKAADYLTRKGWRRVDHVHRWESPNGPDADICPVNPP
jgi:hypothetical protein